MNLNGINFNNSQIADVCKKYGIKEMSLFGSILSNRFSDKSDVDVMITFLPQLHRSYFDLLEIKEQLSDIMGRDIDLVEKEAIKNPYRRKRILNNLQVIYGD